MPFSHIFQCLFLATHGEEKLRRSFPFQGENKKCAQNYSATFRPATTILMKLFSALTHLAIHPLLALLAHLAHLAILDVRVLMKSQELNRLRAQQRASYPENSHNIINNVGKVEETCRLCGNGSWTFRGKYETRTTVSCPISVGPISQNPRENPCTAAQH